MNKLTRYMQTYLLVGLPFIVVSVFWKSQNYFDGSVSIIREILSWNLMLWFSVLPMFLIILVIAPKARELTLRRLANIKERDEREEIITGRAARVTYISTLSLLIFLFFCSIFSVSIQRIPTSQSVNGKHHTLNISLIFNAYEKKDQNGNKDSTAIFATQNFSLSKSSVLTILIAWQLITFNLIARREQGRDLLD